MDEDEIITVPFEDDDLDSSAAITRTYRMDFEKKRIVGFVDGEEAVSQAMTKELQTRRFAYLIYDDQYGCDLFNKIGTASLTQEYLDSDIPAMIEDCLLAQEAVIAVEELSYNIVDNDSVSINLKVRTEYGESEIEGVLRNGS